MPGEVNVIVEKENIALATEIESRKNDKIIKEIKDLYSKRYLELKVECETIKENHSTLRCMATYLVSKNEMQMVKKIILEEAYKEITNNELKALDDNSSLMN